MNSPCQNSLSKEKPCSSLAFLFFNGQYEDAAFQRKGEEMKEYLKYLEENDCDIRLLKALLEAITRKEND